MKLKIFKNTLLTNALIFTFFIGGNISWAAPTEVNDISGDYMPVKDFVPEEEPEDNTSLNALMDYLNGQSAENSLYGMDQNSISSTEEEPVSPEDSYVINPPIEVTPNVYEEPELMGADGPTNVNEAPIEVITEDPYDTPVNPIDVDEITEQSDDDFYAQENDSTQIPLEDVETFNPWSDPNVASDAGPVVAYEIGAQYAMVAGDDISLTDEQIEDKLKELEPAAARPDDDRATIIEKDRDLLNQFARTEEGSKFVEGRQITVNAEFISLYKAWLQSQIDALKSEQIAREAAAKRAAEEAIEKSKQDQLEAAKAELKKGLGFPHNFEDAWDTYMSENDRDSFFGGLKGATLKDNFITNFKDWYKNKYTAKQQEKDDVRKEMAAKAQARIDSMMKHSNDKEATYRAFKENFKQALEDYGLGVSLIGGKAKVFLKSDRTLAKEKEESKPIGFPTGAATKDYDDMSNAEKIQFLKQWFIAIKKWWEDGGNKWTGPEAKDINIKTLGKAEAWMRDFEKLYQDKAPGESAEASADRLGLIQNAGTSIGLSNPLDKKEVLTALHDFHIAVQKADKRQAILDALQDLVGKIRENGALSKAEKQSLVAAAVSSPMIADILTKNQFDLDLHDNAPEKVGTTRRTMQDPRSGLSFTLEQDTLATETVLRVTVDGDNLGDLVIHVHQEQGEVRRARP